MANDARTMALERLLDDVKCDVLPVMRSDAEAFQKQSTAQFKAVHDQLGAHVVQTEQTANKLSKCEQEVYHVIPPKLAEQGMIIALVKEQLASGKCAQDEWNEQSGARQTAIEERAVVEIEELRASHKQSALAITSCEKEHESLASQTRADAQHTRTVEKVVQVNNATLSKAVEVIKTDAERRFLRQELALTHEVSALRAHMKKLFDSMEEEMTSKIKHSPNSPIHLSPEDQKSDTLDGVINTHTRPFSREREFKPSGVIHRVVVVSLEPLSSLSLSRGCSLSLSLSSVCVCVRS